MNEPRPFPARIAVLAGLLLSLPTLQHVLAGELSVATAALRFGLALVVATLAVHLVLAAVPAPVAEPPAEEEPDVPEVPARRADDHPADESAHAA